MNLSSEFKKFALQFIQDLDRFAANEEEMYAFVLEPFQGEERFRLREFIDRLMKDSISDGELQKIWYTSDADVVFADGAALRLVLKGARNRL